MKELIEREINALSKQFIALRGLTPQIEKVAELCAAAIKNGRKIMFCGNGGSAADAQHLAAEVVGRYKLDRPSMAAIALTVDTSILTSVGNDYGFDRIFSRQVEGLGQAGDVLVGISTSGNSQNVLRAFEMAQKKSVTTVALTGASGGKLKELADYLLNVPADVTNHIQAMHIAVGHLICEIIEREIHA